MCNPTVTLIRCTDYSQAKIAEAIARQFELLGGLEKFVSRGDTVLLKPNFIAPKSRRHATQTDPAVILETARLLTDFGAKPFVGDSPAWADVFSCVKALKLEETLKKLSVPVKQLDKLYPGAFLQGEETACVLSLRERLRSKLLRLLPRMAEHFAQHNEIGRAHV